MQEGWAQQEVGQAQLGHAARTTRLVRVVEDLAASQEGVPLGLLFQHVWVREEETVPEEEQDRLTIWLFRTNRYGIWRRTQVSKIG